MSVAKQQRDYMCKLHDIIPICKSHYVYYYVGHTVFFQQFMFCMLMIFLFYKMAVKALCQKIIKQQCSHTSEK